MDAATLAVAFSRSGSQRIGRATWTTPIPVFPTLNYCCGPKER